MTNSKQLSLLQQERTSTVSFGFLKHAFRMLTKRLLFPGLDIATRKRMIFCKYFLSGDVATLDAGCGNGAFSFHAYTLGNKVLGINFDANQVRRCEEFRDHLGYDQERCRFKVHNIYDLVRLGERFDQVICFETLEHLRRDQKALRLFAGILNPGGLLHLCTPCLNRKPYFGERISIVEDGGHLRLGYTVEMLEAMMRREGFELMAQDRAVGPVSQLIMNLGRWLMAVPFKRLWPILGEGAAGTVVLILSPLTWLEKLWPESSHLCVYVQGRVTAYPANSVRIPAGTNHQAKSIFD